MQSPPSLPSSVAPGIPDELDRMVLALLAKDPNARPTLQQVMQVLAYYRDTQRPSQAPTAPHAAATMMAPGTTAVLSTMGRSSGEMVPAGPQSRGRIYSLAALGVLAAAGVAIALVLSGSKRDQPAATPQQPPIVAAPADAASIAPSPDAAVAAVPIDAAAEAAVTPDAATATVVEPPTPPPTKKPPTKKPPTTKPPTTKPPETTPKPPPPDDDDGLIRVTPRKN
jgi:hypothetical protein